MIAIDLPWPHRDLHPNARVHWSARAKAVKKARALAGWTAKACGIRAVAASRLSVTTAFTPPDGRQRDTDGMLSAIKAYIDGVADVVGVDDSRWDITLRRESPKKPGTVRIEIEVSA